ncbi:hypothetical protein RUM44_011141 [Polyplax serrata]|uniref:Uncharacterized protein n=1 Tax=Polyplax serrata TaxID=468196 RepID=A0ABR1AP65_POLSC
MGKRFFLSLKNDKVRLGDVSLGKRVSQFHEEGAAGNISIFPYFDFNVPRNVTTAVGQTAFLHCRVEQLGDKAVDPQPGEERGSLRDWAKGPGSVDPPGPSKEKKRSLREDNL